MLMRDASVRNFTRKVLLDYIRLYLLIGLGTRNIVGLFVCFVFFFLVLYIEVGSAPF